LYEKYADHEPMDEKVVIPEGENSEDDFFEHADSDDEIFRFNFKSFVAEEHQTSKK
jgi:hypothetical protein